MKYKIKYYRRYQIIVGGDNEIPQFACVICKQNKGKCIPFSNLGEAVKCIDILSDGFNEKCYCISNTKSWRR